MDFPKKAVTWLWEGSESKDQRESVASTFQKKPSEKVWLVLDAPRRAGLSGVLGFYREGPEEAPTYRGFYREGPEKAPTYIGFYREGPQKAPTYMGFYREGPEKAPIYISFYREGPEKAPSSTEKAPRRPRLTLVFTGKAPLTPFGFYKSKWRRIAFELEKLIMSRCVTCAIVSVVALVSLRRGGSGLCGTRQLALRKRGGYDWTTFGFKKPMQFGRRVEVPPQYVIRTNELCSSITLRGRNCDNVEHPSRQGLTSLHFLFFLKTF